MISKEKIGFNAFWWERLWDENSIAEVAKCLRGLGYAAVEYKETSFNPEANIEDEFKRAVNVSRDNGMDVSNFVILRNASDPQIKDKTIEDVTGCIRACAAAGIDTLNLTAGAMPPEVAPPGGGKWWLSKRPAITAAWDNSSACFEQYLRVAEECKVYLAVEACVGQIVHDYYTTLELLRRFDSQYLRLTLDPSHYLLYGNDIPWAIRQLGDKIKHVHLKDAVGGPGRFGRDFLFPILGEGAINWSEFFEALEAIDYNGYVSAEFESFKYMDEVLGNDPAKAAELTMQSIKGITGI